jgi:hypothetical protein
VTQPGRDMNDRTPNTVFIDGIRKERVTAKT